MTTGSGDRDERRRFDAWPAKLITEGQARIVYSGGACEAQLIDCQDLILHHAPDRPLPPDVAVAIEEVGAELLILRDRGRSCCALRFSRVEHAVAFRLRFGPMTTTVGRYAEDQATWGIF